ncbi:MAG: tetratricopeptide repeat protein [Candidatus Obscuribacterales bacterium]|jgi:tetratricopeptide (TPR) repeat protein|nr:tetratricopeptide repeat protein [Candidatus Obscuribacterales bacterium]
MQKKISTRIIPLVILLTLLQLPLGAKQKQPTRMMKIGDEVVSIDAGEAFFKAQENLTNRQFDQAAEKIKQFLASYPNSSAGRYKYGFILLQQGKDTEALEQAKLCTKLKPTFFGGWALMGEACMNLKLEDQAKEAYQKALAIQPTGENADIIRENLADMSKQQEVSATTAVQEKQVTAQNQVITTLNNALALCDRANQLGKQGQYEQGRQACHDALKAAPDSTQVKENVVIYLNNYAANCVQNQNLKQAEELMKESLSLQAKGGISLQSQKTTLKNYSTLLKFLGRNDEAKPLDEKLSSIGTSN